MRVPDFDGANNTGDEQSPTPKPISKVNYLNKLADQIRGVWIEEMRKFHLRYFGRVYPYKPGPRLDGGRDARGALYKPIWPKFAKFILDQKVNPAQFIKAQFENCHGKPPASPAMLISSKALARYNEYRNNREVEKDLTIAKDAQTRTATDAIRFYKLSFGPSVDTYRSVIMDMNLALSALFRYTLAKNCKQEDLMTVWFEPALIQYLYEYDAYDIVWGSLIPPEIKSAAAETIAIKTLAGEEIDNGPNKQGQG